MGEKTTGEILRDIVQSMIEINDREQSQQVIRQHLDEVYKNIEQAFPAEPVKG